jgi:predicted nuclease of predicted toxin-antitoxin system
VPAQSVTDVLSRNGHDALHVIDAELAGAPDASVLKAAQQQSRILVSADTDFGEILARSEETTPSVILLRRSDRTAHALAGVLLANLDAVADDLAVGAFVVITDQRLRIRSLPITSPQPGA